MPFLTKSAVPNARSPRRWLRWPPINADPSRVPLRAARPPISNPFEIRVVDHRRPFCDVCDHARPEFLGSGGMRFVPECLQPLDHRPFLESGNHGRVEPVAD